MGLLFGIPQKEIEHIDLISNLIPSDNINEENYFLQHEITDKRIITNDKLDNDTYHNSITETFANIPYKECLSATQLAYAKSELDLFNYLSTVRVENKAFNIGTMFHTLLLEPEKFEFFLFDDSEKYTELINEGSKSPRSTTKYKEWYNAEMQKNVGKVAVDTKENYQKLQLAKHLITNDNTISSLMKNAKKEISFFVQYDFDLHIKIRPDMIKFATVQDVENLKEYASIKEGDVLYISLKTTMDASPTKWGFIKQYRNLQYHVKESFYNDVLASIHTDCKVHTLILAVEPQTCKHALYVVDDSLINEGRKAYKENLKVWKKFQNRNYQILLKVVTQDNLKKANLRGYTNKNGESTFSLTSQNV